MSIKRATLYVDGMTCAACENRVSKGLMAIHGVIGAEARVAGGKVLVEYDDSATAPAAMKAAIERIGYAVHDRKKGGTTVALGVGLLLAAGYLMASSSGVFNALPKVDASIGYAMLFVVGLLTSIHCVAMCGGIALSQSVGRLGAGGAASPASSKGRLNQMVPGLLYNAGRVLSYTIVGGIVGALGSAFSFSPTIKGIIAGAAGIFMVFLGLKMLGVLRSLPQLGKLLPAGLRGRMGRLGSSLRSHGPFAVGLLNGLMPCGPLQTMQLYALGTGSALTGALSMLIFSAGTVPLMLIFGATAALLPRRFVPVMVKASAVLVMFLGVMTFGRAAALAGVALPELPVLSLASAQAPGQAGPGRADATLPILQIADTSQAQGGLLKATVANGVQTIVTEFKEGYYVPFTVQAGLPLKWTIRIKAEDLNGCNNPVTVPAYGIRKTMVAGDNLVEFTPAKAGVIAYSCWMGMIRSRITVVSDLGSAAETLRAQNLPDLSGSGQGGAGGPGAAAGGAGCCSGTTNPAFAGGKVPVDTIGMPVVKNGVQEITITVNAQGYSPAAIVLQKGMKAIIRFKPEALSSCNSPVVFPEYNGALDLAKGELETPAIPITADFTFQCWMGMVHGYVKTVDDLSKIDVEEIRTEIGKYRASGGPGGASGAGGCCGGGAPVAKK